VRPRPNGHGAINDTRWQDGQPISLDGVIVADTQATLMSEFHTISGAAFATLDSSALFKWTEEGGLALQRYVKLAGALDPPLAPQPHHLAYQLQFLADDPRAYSQVLQTQTSTALSTAAGGLRFPMTFPFTFTASSGGVVTVTNGGNRSTPPVLRVYGLAVDPSIVNLTTGGRITLNGTIGSGDYLELDIADRTAKLNGSLLQAGSVDTANSTWFELAPGDNQLQLVAGSFDSSALLQVLFRDAYV
jgi:hypothetical protein